MAFSESVQEFAKKFQEKAGELGRNISDKTNVIIENNKDSMKIGSEKKHIAELKARLGEICYQRFKDEVRFDQQADTVCEEIQRIEKNIASLQSRIQARKAVPKEQVLKDETQQFTQGHCAKCGALLRIGSEVCPRCGAETGMKAADSEAEEMSDPSCSICGSAAGKEGELCPECGAPHVDTEPILESLEEN